MSKKNLSKNSKPGFFKRLMRTTSSIVVLSTLVLAISFLVRELADLNVSKLEYLTNLLGIENKVIGEVAGNFAVRVSSTDVSLNKDNVAVKSNNESIVMNDIASAKSQRVELNNSKTLKFKVALFADSHNDIEYLTKALNSSKQEGVNSIFHLGDMTDLGITADLQKSKSLLDEFGMTYYAIPGDRDLWESVGPDNFIAVFGENYHTVVIDSVKFLVLDNSANYSTIPESLFKRFLNEVNTADFVLLSQPLYLSNSTKVMGVVDGEPVSRVKDQADEMLSVIRRSNVKAIISAEQHISSESTDLVNPELKHIVVGAITSTINDKPQSLLQSSRYSILNIYTDNSYDIKQIIL